MLCIGVWGFSTTPGVYRSINTAIYSHSCNICTYIHTYTLLYMYNSHYLLKLTFLSAFWYYNFQNFILRTEVHTSLLENMEINSQTFTLYPLSLSMNFSQWKHSFFLYFRLNHATASKVFRFLIPPVCLLKSNHIGQVKKFSTYLTEWIYF